jgi:AcrR family transcriptional regulator
MPRNKELTRQRLIDAACTLAAEENVSQLSVERIAERAGVSRRTFFLHFPSKDDLLKGLVDSLSPTYLDRYRSWADTAGPGADAEKRILRIFEEITVASTDPFWRGCNFTRISFELANMPGHPVHDVVARAHFQLESWLKKELTSSGYEDPVGVARQILVMINGLLTVQLITHSPTYGEALMPQVRDLLSRHRPASQERRLSG